MFCRSGLHREYRSRSWQLQLGCLPFVRTAAGDLVRRAKSETRSSDACRNAGQSRDRIFLESHFLVTFAPREFESCSSHLHDGKTISFASRVSSSSIRVSHSQIINGLHPIRVSRSMAFSSRATLALNFRCQNSLRVPGLVAKRQPGCRCQKQPCTKITTLCLGRTRSGLPGIFRTWRRYRNPAACKARLTRSSGFVSLPPIADIIRDRVRSSTISVTTSSESE